MLALGCNVGVAAAGRVVETTELGSKTCNVGRDDTGLVRRAREVVAEATAAGKIVARVERSNFGVEVLRRANRGDVGAAVWEGGQEGRGVFAVVGEAFAARSDAIVTAGAEKCNATCS